MRTFLKRAARLLTRAAWLLVTCATLTGLAVPTATAASPAAASPAPASSSAPASLSAAAASPASAEPVPIDLPRFPTKPTEVVIIGTMHSAQLEFEAHSPARIRALLNRIDPAAVGVETPPEWYAEGIYFDIAYESYGVAVPWAMEKGKEVRPIDWMAPALEQIGALAWPSVQPEPAAADEDERLPTYTELLESWDVPPLLFADTPEWHEAVNRAYANADASPNPYSEAGRRYMLYRNLIIARHIVNMAADHEGQRVAVLIGAAHKPDLDLFLSAVPNIVVRQASEWAGPTAAEVAAEERRADHLAILWYNLAGSRVQPEDVDLARMDRLLAGLERETPLDPEVRFLRARWHHLRGDTVRAVALYTALAWGAQWEDRPFTFPDRSLYQRMIDWGNAADPWGPPVEYGLDNVFSSVGNLTVRQRVLYELALQQQTPAARERARSELVKEQLTDRQRGQLQALLDPPAAESP